MRLALGLRPIVTNEDAVTTTAWTNRCPSLDMESLSQISFCCKIGGIGDGGAIRQSASTQTLCPQGSQLNGGSK